MQAIALRQSFPQQPERRSTSSEQDSRHKSQGGRKMTVKGHAVTPERIDAMKDAEIEKLHARYEARLGAAMSKSLGSSLLHM